MQFQVNLRQVTYALSDALDMVGVDSLGHGKRVAYMAAECANQLAVPRERYDRLICAAILHDCGVSSTRIHQHLIQDLDWSGAQAHCDWGHALLRRCPPLADLAEPVRLHHTHWRVLERQDHNAEDVEIANLIFLTDRVDALCAQHGAENLLLARKEISAVIREQAGRMFSPYLVDAFFAVSQRESFWLALGEREIDHYLRAWVARGATYDVDSPSLRAVADIFATVVDAKSPFTAEHSRGVAALSRKVGSWAGLDGMTCDKLELAGLLHDLGKLRVPDEILEKTGPLDDRELAVMARHSFDTYAILEPIEGLHEVALWAAMHHEKVSGEGYPFRHSGDSLPLEARILAVADVFQALAQERPYRHPLPPDEIVRILGQMVDRGHLDGDMVGLVAERADESWASAMQITDTGGVPRSRTKGMPDDHSSVDWKALQDQWVGY